MNAQDELLRLYAEWRRLTEDEGLALSAADWLTVAKCQEEKAAIQAALPQVAARCERQAAGGRQEAALFQAEIRAQIQTLIDLERANQATLAHQRELHLQRQNELNLTSRTLGRVQRSYVTRHSATWQSYS